MAEFALGLTKTAVEGTLIRVKAAIEEEARLKVTVQNDLVFITCEFEMMQSFLNVTNAAERVKNQVVRTWLRQLRDLAFDVEDCVDFVLHLDDKSGWWWRMVPSFMAPLLPLDEAVAEIKQLKARVEDVSRRNTRYNLIGSSDSGSNSNSKLPVAAAASSTAFHILNKVWEDAGRRRRGMGDLQKLITSEGTSLGVVSVWGSASSVEAGLGGGTTSLIRTAYGDPEICQEFRSRAWVKVMHPFNPDEFLNSLLAQFYATSHQANHQVGSVDFFWKTTEDNHLMKAELMHQVKEQRYLVVLEGISTVAEWDAIRKHLPDNNKGSRIVVSTNNLGIALLCTGEPYQVADLRRFSQDQYLCAFFKEGSGRRSDMGELNWQLRCRGTVSVWGKGEVKSVLMKRTYKGIMNKSKEFEGVEEFKHHILFDVPTEFDLIFFSRTLLAGCYSKDQTNEIEAVYMMQGPEVIRRCCKFLREDHCLVVINGLRSTDDWDSIKISLLSEPTKGSIVVITEEKSVATHCVDQEYRALNVKDLEADAARGLLVKGQHYYGYGRELEASSHTESRLFAYRREKALEWTNKSELLGRENDVLKLEQRLTHPGVISVWGIAGVGKSTLVKSIYYKQMANVREHDMARINDAEEFSKLKFVTYSWVDVPCPFNLTEFSRLLLLDFHSDDREAMESTAVGMMEGQDPIQGCLKFLRQDKCLVVIDGLRSTDDWNLIKDTFLSQPTTGCIVVITNEASVATHCVHHGYQVLNIKSLEPDAALALFKKTPWGRNQSRTSDELQLSKLTMKCGGLPKVISSIGKYSGSSSSLMEDLTDNFMGKLETDPGFHSLKDLFSWMQHYFDACSDSLKPCIFYLSVFPAEHSIRRRRLLRRWIAEGYSRDTSAGSTAEEKAEVLFSELVKLSIVQQQPTKISGKVVLCQINGFFYGYIVSQPMEDNLVFALEGRCSHNSQCAGQHLTIRSSWDRDETVFKGMDLSRLRSLTVFGEWRSFFISSCSSNMRLLRVLDLEDTTDLTDDDLDKIEKLPPRLKFLSLRNCTHVTCLPDSVGELRQLQTLDVRGTSIVSMPESIANLNKLQYIRAGTMDESATSAPSHVASWLPGLCRRRHLVGVKVPGGIGKLTTLHTLGVINIRASGGKAFLTELKKLTQLSKLGVSGIDRRNSKDFFSAISGHGHFKSLSVQLNKNNSQGCLDGIPLPLDNLRSLKLYGLTDKLPAWSDRLSKLAKLDLEMATLMENGMKFLRKLPQLRSLHLAVKQRSLHFCGLWNGIEVRSYEKVKILEICCSSSSLRVTFGSEAMKNLELLKLDCSSESPSYQLSGQDRLSELKQVLLMGTNDKTLKKTLEKQLDNHPRRPAVKLEEPPRSS